MVRKNNGQLCTIEEKTNYTWIAGRKQKIHDCYGVLEKTAWIWRIVGIFPFALKKRMGLRKYEINKFYAVYGFLICCGSIGNWIYSMTEYGNWVRKKPQISVEYLTLGIRSSATQLCMAIASIWRIFRHKEISEIVQTMVEQDLSLEKMNCSLQYESHAKIICTYVSTMSITAVLLMVYEYVTSDLDYDYILTRWLFWIAPATGQVLDVTIFVSLVGLLGSKFRALNEKINTVAMRVNSSAPKIIVTADTCAENLRKIAKAHYRICTIGKRINSFFNTIVIINVTSAFIVVSTTLYYIFVEVHREAETSYIRIGSCLHWEFVQSVPIILIVAICNWTSHQSTYTGKLIHEIEVKKIDSRLYESVKTFSLQLHHQKLEFNAGGLFPLNSTLIQTMVANITTYLVILIQFQPKLDIDNT